MTKINRVGKSSNQPAKLIEAESTAAKLATHRDRAWRLPGNGPWRKRDGATVVPSKDETLILRSRTLNVTNRLSYLNNRIP